MVLYINKELSGEGVWSKVLDYPVTYTSTQVLADFMNKFNLNRGALCASTGVFARFEVVCPKTHQFCPSTLLEHPSTLSGPENSNECNTQ